MQAGADDLGERRGADVPERDILGQQVVGELVGQAHPELAGLAVDDQAGDAGGAQVPGDLVCAAEGVVAERRAAVGDDDQQRPATWVADPRLLEVADLVTEMQHVKHPFDNGQKGQRGIEW